MANNYFQFKQFTIWQDRCAMKVCTDSCVFGAWSANRLKGTERILDIGTGTGLLSLMLAQEAQAAIDALELDEDAAKQAAENIAASPWPDRIRLIQQDIRSYKASGCYDFIISNPPFFEDDLRSPSYEKNKARHDETLTLETMMMAIQRLLRSDGAFSVLVPHHRTHLMESLATRAGYCLREKMLLRQSPSHGAFRSLLWFSAGRADQAETKELIIRDEQGRETTALLDLMKPYYLR